MTDNSDNLEITAEQAKPNDSETAGSPLSDNISGESASYTADNTEDKQNTAAADGAYSHEGLSAEKGENAPSFGVPSQNKSGARDYLLLSGDQLGIPVDGENSGIHDDVDIVPLYLRRFSEENPLKKVASKLPAERERSSFSENLLRVISGCALGVGCGLLFIALLYRGLLMQTLLTILSFLCAFAMSGYICDYTRMISSLLCGGKVCYLRLFCLKINTHVPDEAGAKRRFQPVYPSGDRAVSIPPDGYKVSEDKYLLFFGLNILVLALALLLSAASAVIGGSPVLTAVFFGFLLRFVLRLFGGISDGVPSDGTILYALLTRSMYTAGYIKLYIAYSEMRAGVRPRNLRIPSVGIYIPSKRKVSRIRLLIEKAVAAKIRSERLAREAMNFASEGDELAEMLDTSDYAAQELDIPSGESEDTEDTENGEYGGDVLRRYPDPVGDNRLLADFTYLFYISELDSLSGEHLFSYAKILLRSADRAPEYLRGEIYRELCFVCTIGHNPIEAADIYRICEKNDELPTLRMRAWYTAVVLENHDEAEEICSYALRRSAHRIRFGLTRTPGRDLAEMLLLERLRKEISQ